MVKHLLYQWYKSGLTYPIKEYSHKVIVFSSVMHTRREETSFSSCKPYKGNTGKQNSLQRIKLILTYHKWRTTHLERTSVSKYNFAWFSYFYPTWTLQAVIQHQGASASELRLSTTCNSLQNSPFRSIWGTHLFLNLSASSSQQCIYDVFAQQGGP
jgi:hypothetical protein